VLEAMAMKKIVIATPQALEGISATPGDEVVCADGAEQFIHHIGHHLTSFEDIGQAARNRILRDYDWGRNLQRLGRALGAESRTGQTADAEPAR
jgi:hypothetical protein